MKIAFGLVVVISLFCLAKCDNEAKLQIGVKKRVPPEECTRKSQNKDHLEMHYTVR